MQTKIQKWGNSLGIRIPRSFSKEAGLDNGTTIEISLENDKIIINPIRKRKYLLEDLVNRVNSNNIHAEVETGNPVGGETW
jgi:antitoxin MazE